MKKIGRILLVFLMAICMTCMVIDDAWAGAQVYITFSIGGGLFISMVGICFQAVFLQQIAQEQEEQKKMAASDSSIEKLGKSELSPPQAERTDRVSASLDP